MSRVVGRNSLTLQGNSNFRLSRDEVVHLETAANVAGAKQMILSQFFYFWVGVTSPSITVSHGAGHLMLIATLFWSLLAPSLPPQNIRGHNTSSSSIKIYWEPVPEANRHGIVREYHFYIYPIQSPVSSFDDVDTTGDLYKTFTGLEPYSNYSIQMAAKTVELGNFSEPIFVMTDEAGKDVYIYIQL